MATNQVETRKVQGKDFITNLYEAGCSLRTLANSFEGQERYGDAHMMSLLADEINTIAQHLDNEHWGPIPAQ